MVRFGKTRDGEIFSVDESLYLRKGDDYEKKNICFLRGDLMRVGVNWFYRARLRTRWRRWTWRRPLCAWCLHRRVLGIPLRQIRGISPNRRCPVSSASAWPVLERNFRTMGKALGPVLQRVCRGTCSSTLYLNSLPIREFKRCPV